MTPDLALATLAFPDRPRTAGVPVDSDADADGRALEASVPVTSRSAPR